MKIKRMRNILVLAMVLSLLMVIIPFAPVSAAAPAVSLTAPANVAAGSGFYVTVNITDAVLLNGFSFHMLFDSSVVQMAGLELSTGTTSGVIDGVINGVTIPNLGWTYKPVAGVPGGDIQLLGHLSGISNTSGSGYLARILFKTVGAAGSHSNINLDEVLISDSLANEVTLTNPTAATVTVSSNAAATTAVTTGAATSVTDTSATLNGTLTSLGTATSVNLFLGYSTVQGGPYTLVPKGTATTTSTLPLSFNTSLTGLTAGTTYYYVAQAQYGNPVQIINGAEMVFGGNILPTLTSLNPGSGAPGATLNGVVVTGTNLTGASALTFSGGGIIASNINVTSATQLTATITISGAAALGLRDVTVTAAGGTSAALKDGFSVTSAGAAVMSLTAPANVAAGGNFYVTLNIANASSLNSFTLHLLFDPTVVQMAGLELSSGTTSGVINGLINGTAVPIDGWTYQPTAGTQSGDILLLGHLPVISTANGTGYLARVLLKTIGAAGSHTNISLTGIDLVDSLSLETFPANPAPVTVNISSNPALITSVTTNAVTTLTTTTATLNGTLTSLGSATSVNLFLGYSTVKGGPYTLIPKGTANAATTLPFVFNAPLTGLTPGTQYYCIAEAQYGTPTQIVGGDELTFTPTGTQPTLSSLSPSSGAQGATLTGVVVTGTNLTGATALTFSGAGVTASAINVTSATQLTATITITGAAALGARNVTVTAAAGTSDPLVGGFTVVSPGAATVSLTAPANVAAGSGFYLTVNINNAVALNSYSFNMAFDPAVLQMAGIDMVSGPSSGITNGVIGGVSVPAIGWTYQPNPPGDASGVINLIGHISGVDNATGSGFLARIYMKVAGAAGSHSTLSLSNIDLVNALAAETFPANPTPVTVNVSADPALITSVSTVAADNITASGAILRGTLNSLGTAAAVDLFLGYSTVQGGPYTVLIGPAAVAAPRPFNVSASGLQAGTKYYWIALAQYGSPSQIVTGAELNFTTPGTPLTPAITTISPAAGAQGAVPVIITGTNLNGATAVNFSGSGVSAGPLTVNPAGTQINTTLTITAGAALGVRSVTVSVGSLVSNALSFTVLATGAPTISSINPASGLRGTAVLPVTIVGTNLTGATSVNFSGDNITASGLVVNPTGTQLTANLNIESAAATGVRDVSVSVNTLVSNTLTGAFTVTAPAPYVPSGGGSSPVPPTVSSVSPLNSATGVDIKSAVKAVFSLAMNANTLNTTNFTLTKGTTAVAGTVTYDSTSKTATFTPTAALDYASLYTATITTGALSSTGYSLNSKYVWSFTTVAAPPPTTAPPTTAPPTTAPPTTAPPTTAPPTTVPPTTAPPTTKPVVTTTPVTTVSPTTTTPPPGKTNWGLIIGLIVAAVIIIAIVAILLSRRNRNKTH